MPVPSGSSVRRLVRPVGAVDLADAGQVADGVDGTADNDYTAEREDPTVRELPDPIASTPPGVAHGTHPEAART